MRNRIAKLIIIVVSVSCLIIGCGKSENDTDIEDENVMLSDEETFGDNEVSTFETNTEDYTEINNVDKLQTSSDETNEVRDYSATVRKLVVKPNYMVLTDMTTGEQTTIMDEDIVLSVLDYIEHMPVQPSEDDISKIEDSLYCIAFMRDDNDTFLLEDYVWNDIIKVRHEMYYYSEGESLTDMLSELMDM